MRAIDADALGLTDVEIIMCDGSYKEALRVLLDKIEKAPAIETQIVRCKDCKYYGYHECFHGRGLIAAFDNTFCSYAESIREVRG